MDPRRPTIVCYAATKHAVKAITDGLRNELHAARTHIRVTVRIVLENKIGIYLKMNTF